MKRIGRIIAAALAVAMLAIAMAPQAAAAGSYEQQRLQIRYDLTAAHVEFMTGVMTDTVSLIPQASALNAHVSKLNGDLTQLQGYVSASDVSGFNAYMQGTLQPDLKAAGEALRDCRTHYREWGVNNSTRVELREMYQARKATFDAHVNQARVQIGQYRLDHYNGVMSKTDARISNMASKGIDVTAMQSLRNDVQASVVDPLQSAVNTGNGETVMNEVGARSLFNGAPYSFHYAARMDLAALTAVTDDIEANATQAGYGDRIAQVRAKLASAEATLNVVGTGPYAAGQSEQVFGDLKAASEQLKAIIQAMNKGGQS